MNDPHIVEDPTFIHNRYSCITPHHLYKEILSDRLPQSTCWIHGTVNLMSPPAILLVQDSRSRGHTLHLASVPPLRKAADHLGKRGSRNIIIAQMPFVHGLHASSMNPLAASECKRRRHNVRLPKKQQSTIPAS